jgi:hypothetical protein
MNQRRQVLTSFAAAPCAWLTGLATAATPAQRAGTDKPELSAVDAERDLRILQRCLAELHPGLTRYASAARIDAAFDAAVATVAAGSSRAQMVLLASQLSASVHCGHTWANPFNQRLDVIDQVLTRADKLPLTLRWVEGRALVTGRTAQRVAAGDEVLAIDDRPLATIRAALLPLLRADGLHEGAGLKQASQLDSRPNGGAMDRLFPLRFPPRNGRYMLTLSGRGSPSPNAVDVAPPPRRHAISGCRRQAPAGPFASMAIPACSHCPRSPSGKATSSPRHSCARPSTRCAACPTSSSINATTKVATTTSATCCSATC